MTENKGKRGEMVVSVIAASISHKEDGVDFTRPSVTNSADMGADLFIQHPAGFLGSKLLPVADGSYLPPPADAQSASDIPNAKPAPALRQTTRVDVKTTDSKLGKGTVEKFVADTAKHPTCTGHLLVGGSGLTKPAERTLAQAQQSYEKDGKIFAHVNNEGIRRLAEHYRPPEPNLTSEASQKNTPEIDQIDTKGES